MQSSAQRTAPIGLLVAAIASIRQLVIPLVVAGYALRDNPFGLGGVLAVLFAILAGNVVVSFLRWRRLTYTTGSEDIRVESGIVSRAARSVPYERIQDVSLEQRLLPRLFGLVEVKFETGAGGADDLALAYLTEDEGEALRRLIRERRDEERTSAAVAQDEEAPSTAAEENSETVFSMDTKRLVTFGFFEFSLAVFAVIAGLFQYADNLFDSELEFISLATNWTEAQLGKLTGLGTAIQILGVFAGLLGLLIVGSATGFVRTFLRDWGFVLEKTARGFRRRRGLFTKTDVVMPVHRVQALVLGTGWLRYRFGWHGLKFVSLAQDAGASNHDVAPFAQIDEIEPIIRAAQFEPVDEELDWHLASAAHRNVRMAISGATLALVGIAVFVLLTFGPIDNVDFGALLALLPFAAGLFLVVRAYFIWRFARNAISSTQIFRRAGWLSPSTIIASRVKLHSVEIVQGPIAQRRGYATLHLGLAGGRFAVSGLPLARAKALKAAILASIAARDFSQLN